VHVIAEAADEHFEPADAGELRTRLGLEGPYLLYVGGLVHRDARKNVDGLIDAFARWARAESRSETLVLAGAMGAAGRELERRAALAGARVKFTGFVEDRDLPALYSGAACFVTATRYEGFCLPALEAIACGTPVVAFHVGAVPETAGPGALLARATDGDDLMRCVAQVCDDPALRRELAAEGRRHASNFSWRRTASLTWQVYEGVAR
jgi:glycosyltransferase involved in cell wall biosynthesis